MSDHDEERAEKVTGGQGDDFKVELVYSPALEKANGTYGTPEELARRYEATRNRINPDDD